MRFDILTLFPEMFTNVLGTSILGRGVESDRLEFNILNIRDFSQNKHKKVDDYPYGGGAGMVMQAEPIKLALASLEHRADVPVIYLTPKGKVLDQRMVEKLAKNDKIVLLCGHYEGVDQRVLDRLVSHEISVGDYVLTGGEIPAMILIDAVSRLQNGVLNKNESHEEESFSAGLLEHPHYTRPYEFEGDKVPEVLISGNHKLIDQWRFDESVRLTYERRPEMIKDLLKDNSVSEDIKRKAKKVLDIK